MYRYKKSELIQDIQPKRVSDFEKIQNRFLGFLNDIKNKFNTVRNNIQTWYEETDFEQAGHDTARVLLSVGKKIHNGWDVLLNILGHFTLCLPLILILYCLIQFFLLFKGLRPEFLDVWMNSWNLKLFPEIFQGGHPILQTYIFFVCIDYIIRTIRTIYEFRFFSRYRTVWKHILFNVEPYIFSFIFVGLIFTHWVYYAIGAFMVLCFLKNILCGSYEEKHGFSIYDSDGNFVGTVEKF